MDDITLEEMGEDLFAVKSSGWRVSDDGAILLLYSDDEWPFWRWRLFFSSPFTYPEVQNRAYELKVISFWRCWWTVFKFEVFHWLPEDWDIPDGLFDEEE